MGVRVDAAGAVISGSQVGAVNSAYIAGARAADRDSLLAAIGASCRDAGLSEADRGFLRELRGRMEREGDDDARSFVLERMAALGDGLLASAVWKLIETFFGI